MYSTSLFNADAYFVLMAVTLLICIGMGASKNIHFILYYLLIARLVIVIIAIAYTKYIKKNIRNMENNRLLYHIKWIYFIQYIPLCWSLTCIILLDKYGVGNYKNKLVVYTTILFIITDISISLFQICASNSLRVYPYVGIAMMNLVNINKSASEEEINKIHEHTFITNETVSIYGKKIILKCDDKCTICLSNYNDNEQIRIIMCGHYYHKQCIDEWFKSEFICPNCRYDIKENNFGQELEIIDVS